ncbi:D-alanyl-D-alanine carboxypeptidase/D-alanyl-D-alanine endopeptidase [Albidovulum inexpectatum]|nr:D-alanyl-D-alanine carboxypeptidase/D-alanyl-D-alanine-endopeptidase [Albidovulum inexpectatum]
MAASTALPAWAEAPARSPRPPVRPGFLGANVPQLSEIVARADLGGRVGFALVDLSSGGMLESLGAETPMPPASTAKVVTALYALAQLGAEYRFATQLIVTGPISNGRVRGDVVLAGGGDPTLTTDGLADLVEQMAGRGITGVDGALLVWAGALPFVEALDPTQPEWLGYNPAVSGLNLNFNRVHFAWKKVKAGYEVALEARDRRFSPPVRSARMRVVEREQPVYARDADAQAEEWSVARAALGRAGSRWLPVRRPDLYAGDVLWTLARAKGIDLPRPRVVAERPQGRNVAEVQSATLRDVLRGMLRYSTNITAEAVGMAASARLGATSHVESARKMTDWVRDAAGLSIARFVDHSGLSGASRISADEMVRVLTRLGPDANLRDLLKPVKPDPETTAGAIVGRADIRAKTGTLNFVSALAGYINGDGRDMAFAIFSGDVARRDAVPDAQKERPPGGRAWLGRARRMQQEALARWIAVYAS